MADFILCAPNEAALVAAAVAMGFADALGNIITQGRIPGDSDPHASYFLNVVGEVEQPTGETTTDAQGNSVPVMAVVPGWWARIRVNGLNPFASGLIAIPPSLTVYALVTLPDGSPTYWSADGGVTPAPDYVAGIGVIA